MATSARLTHPSTAPAGRKVNRALQAFADSLVRFTWDNELKMMKIGVLPDDSTVELLDGLLVYRDCGDSKREPGMAGIEHDYVVSATADLAPNINSADRHLPTQVTLAATAGSGIEAFVAVPAPAEAAGPGSGCTHVLSARAPGY